MTIDDTARVAAPEQPAAALAVPESAPPGPLSARVRGGWILEAVALLGAAVLHELLRNAEMGKAAVALRNAKTLNSIERWLGIYHDLEVQRFFLNWPFLIDCWNVYYRTAHFLVPPAIAVFLYLKAPARYVRMRNTFLIMLFITGPIGWLVFPVSPPAYLPKSYGFVDTQVKYFNIGPHVPLRYGPDGEPRQDIVDAIGNLYGGMPSHHVSWSLLCVVAIWPVVKRRWVKGLVLLHPLLTIGAITVTGQHHFIDIAGSCIEVALALLLGIALERALGRRRARRQRRKLERELAVGTPPNT